MKKRKLVGIKIQNNVYECVNLIVINVHHMYIDVKEQLFVIVQFLYACMYMYH